MSTVMTQKEDQRYRYNFMGRTGGKMSSLLNNTDLTVDLPRVRDLILYMP